MAGNRAFTGVEGVCRGPPATCQKQQQAMAALKVEVEMQQEELLMSKYGGVLPKSPVLGRRRSSGAHKRFDSAEWALAKQGKQPSDGVDPVLLDEMLQDLPMKLTRTPPPPRRLSNLRASS